MPNPKRTGHLFPNVESRELLLRTGGNEDRAIKDAYQKERSPIHQPWQRMTLSGSVVREHERNGIATGLATADKRSLDYAKFHWVSTLNTNELKRFQATHGPFLLFLCNVHHLTHALIYLTDCSSIHICSPIVPIAPQFSPLRIPSGPRLALNGL
ncbi:hypothetical protein K504DRAFT_505015 [Pleomassaria siparia CBS 279.74]|uniref:Uncharacterized protein n=1 Tax=Pleomassaria siparia CBS 279.74 TaxID=1314801 RepID=A0A6G1K337_9PLEO|nr:hypothetical protein K504DRAFT_505015 [Pleomassaria siparia CBS 279.74]